MLSISKIRASMVRVDQNVCPVNVMHVVSNVLRICTACTC